MKKLFENLNTADSYDRRKGALRVDQIISLILWRTPTFPPILTDARPNRGVWLGSIARGMKFQEKRIVLLIEMINEDK